VAPIGEPSGEWRRESEKEGAASLSHTALSRNSRGIEGTVLKGKSEGIEKVRGE
jgi:hypothetical protein